MPETPDPRSRASVLSSAELLSRFADGDDSALGELFERETPRILNRMRSHLPRDLRPRLGASDLLQLTATELVKMRARFENRGVGAFHEMVGRIADRAMLDAIHRERALKRSPDRERRAPGADPRYGASDGPRSLDPADTHTPSRSCDRNETARRVKACFELLGEPDRRIIHLIDYEEQSYEEAARALGIGRTAARKRHSRAIARLGELVARGSTES